MPMGAKRNECNRNRLTHYFSSLDKCKLIHLLLLLFSQQTTWTVNLKLVNKQTNYGEPIQKITAFSPCLSLVMVVNEQVAEGVALSVQCIDAIDAAVLT